MKRAKDRQPSHSLPVISTSQPEADSSNPPESLLNTSDEDGGQLELDQAFHIFDEEEDGRNEGKHYIAVDDCPNSGDNCMNSYICDKIIGCCVHSKLR